MQVHEIMSGGGHLTNGQLDWELTKVRKKREDQWMRKSRTVYPYGLNDSLNEPIEDVPDHIIGLNFPSLTRSQRSFNHNKLPNL